MEKFGRVAGKMKIFPAIDIQNGYCVRLRQGNALNRTIYGDDPLEMAVKWQSEGAKYLHVVDLDGAFHGKGINAEIISRICRTVSIPVEVGGGIRELKHVEKYMNNGVWRVIIGSKAVEEPDLVTEVVQRWGEERVAVAVDERDGNVVTNGWLGGTSKKIVPFIENFLKKGVSYFIHTDISRDGMLSGPNFDMIGRLQKIPGIQLIASGGISSFNDLVKLKEMGLYGVITGKALYEEKITMEEIGQLQE